MLGPDPAPTQAKVAGRRGLELFPGPLPWAGTLKQQLTLAPVCSLTEEALERGLAVEQTDGLGRLALRL